MCAMDEDSCAHLADSPTRFDSPSLCGSSLSAWAKDRVQHVHALLSSVMGQRPSVKQTFQHSELLRGLTSESPLPAEIQASANLCPQDPVHEITPPVETDNALGSHQHIQGLPSS